MFLKHKKNILMTLALVVLLFGCKSTDTVIQEDNLKDVTKPQPLQPFNADIIDGVLASVSGNIILLSDLQQAIETSTKGATHLLANGQLVGGTLSAKQAESIFQNLVNEKVLQAKTVELGFDVSEDELTSRIKEFLQQQGYTLADLQGQLVQNNKSMEEYRTDFKNQVLKQQLIGRVISPLVSVTDDEVKSFYLQQTGSTKQISRIKLRSLMLNIPMNVGQNPLHATLVRTLQKKIEKKENFVSLVKQYSMAVGAAENEGVLPPRTLAELPPELAKELPHLNVNDVVGPFAIGNSVFFFQYIGAEFKEGADVQTNFATWKSKLLEIKFNERLGQYLQNEREKMKVDIRAFAMKR